MENNSLLQRARKEYKKGDMFLSASGNIKAPMTVSSIKIAENFKGLCNSEGGVIYDQELNKWAVKV